MWIKIIWKRDWIWITVSFVVAVDTVVDDVVTIGGGVVVDIGTVNVVSISKNQKKEK